jgi:sulfur carrier protein
MKIELNGAQHEIGDGTTLISLIEEHAGTTRGSAVVVDGEVVPRGTWPTYLLHEGQRVELIAAVQGG